MVLRKGITADALWLLLYEGKAWKSGSIGRQVGCRYLWSICFIRGLVAWREGKEKRRKKQQATSRYQWTLFRQLISPIDARERAVSSRLSFIIISIRGCIDPCKLV